MLISRHQGFTLIELIIIILIVSIVATVSYPNLSGIWHAQRANSQISTIEQTLHLARNHAINFGTQVTVCPIIDRILRVNAFI
ncbi:MAG: pilus assembly FimT family protein [Shewanella sp.]